VFEGRQRLVDCLCFNSYLGHHFVVAVGRGELEQLGCFGSPLLQAAPRRDSAVNRRQPAHCCLRCRRIRPELRVLRFLFEA
jgi:hypothetical protein